MQQKRPLKVESQVAFLDEQWRERTDLPHIYNRQSRQDNTTPKRVTIHSARPRQEANDLHLDQSGFILVSHQTQVTDFRDKQIVADVYFPEMRDLILAETGAVDAFPVQFYQVRSSDPEHFFDAYSLYMHCDFSPRGWTKLARRMIKAAGATMDYAEPEWDFALYNLWRPIGGAVERDPLVLIDASTVDAADILDYSAMKEPGNARAALPLYNQAQRLYYVPDMQTDELLVFKQLDSRPGHALVCPHTSFDDPTSGPDARPRESIDVRMICIFPK